MKIRSATSLVACGSILTVWLAGLAAAPAAPRAKSRHAATPLVKSNAIPRSVFIVPTNPKKGRDPFFPNSNRLFRSTTPHPRSVPDVTLIYNGLSGAASHKLAIINGHTFAQGESAPVNTSHGRVWVRCLQISQASVTVEVGGQRRKLPFHSGQ